jgi:hypothetical protein
VGNRVGDLSERWPAYAIARLTEVRVSGVIANGALTKTAPFIRQQQDVKN